MPTPDDTALIPPLVRASTLPRSAHPTCPPEDDDISSSTDDNAILGEPRGARIQRNRSRSYSRPREEQQASAGVPEYSRAQSSRHHDGLWSSQSGAANSTSALDQKDDSSASRERLLGSDMKPASPFPTPGPGTPTIRPTPQHTSSFLRNGSRFAGTQQSDRQVYSVSVEIKHVDMRESFVCGYLRIEGLTPEHATLTTYFEGEIIGDKYCFQTRHAEWGSNEKVDMQHWYRFPAWRPLARQARKPDFSYKDYADREHLFMRWKEYFLVPDHRVTSINGASFEGFYYICFNQISGTVSGIYFHSKSEKYQQLELKHVHDYGCKGAQEFA